MKKGSVYLSHRGSLPGPGVSDYRHNGAVVAQKGWSSERVPYPANSNGGSSRRHIGASSLTPFYSGRTLPSKWEDAERWICSPVLGYGVSKNANYRLQRRPKSKSGPIVPPGTALYSNCSPSIQLLDSGGGGMIFRNLMAGSPFSTGVLMSDGVAVKYGGCRGAAAGGDGDGDQSCMVQNDSNVAGSDMVSEPSSPSSQDEKFDEIKDEEMMINRVVSRRDMATQMNPDTEGSSSGHSSPRERSSFGHLPPLILPLPAVEGDDHVSKLDIRLQREEAKISAWENLQRAKAEAAIRKLEMKLEKKRSASTNKILSRLRMAQLKAQEMRSSIAGKEDEHIPKTSKRVAFFHIRMSCFTCHAY